MYRGQIPYSWSLYNGRHNNHNQSQLSGIKNTFSTYDLVLRYLSFEDITFPLFSSKVTSTSASICPTLLLFLPFKTNCSTYCFQGHEGQFHHCRPGTCWNPAGFWTTAAQQINHRFLTRICYSFPCQVNSFPSGPFTDTIIATTKCVLLTPAILRLYYPTLKLWFNIG